MADQSVGGQSPVFLSTLPPGVGQQRLALAVVLLSAVLFAAALPFARVPLRPEPAFIPAYQAALVVADLITAALLFGQFAILRSRGLLLVACAYLFSALIAVVHMLSFPGLFSPEGLLAAGPQTTAWLYMFWHGGFPLLLIAYALSKDTDTHAGPGVARPILAGAAAVAAAVLGFSLLATAGHELLPAIMQGNRYTPAMIVVVSSVWALSLLALVALWRLRRRSVLDLWLMVVMCAWVFDIALAAVLNAGRYDLGFYAGRVYGLFAATLVLVVLLLENAVLYVRLAGALEGERSERRRVQETTAALNALNALLEHRVADRTAELHEIATASATVREQEKTRIARELHDELGQVLTALKMDVGWLKERGPDANEEFSSKLAAMRDLIDDTVAATRRIAADLRPLMLDDLGVVPAIEWLVENFRERNGIECELVIDPPDLELGDPYSTAVFRIVQECLTNVARHAQATRVEVELRRSGDEIRLRVSDNGRGFDPAAPRRPNSFGLVGLRERAYLVSGRIAIDAAPGRGTTVKVTIPLPIAQPGGSR